MVQAIRRFFIDQGYLEVETPQIIPAPAPEAHIDAVRTNMGYLHTSPELCMKRMLAAGFPKIFQLTKCFRANERGTRHLSEFCLLEWYRAGIDYHDLMSECQELIQGLLQGPEKKKKTHYQGTEMDLRSPWPRITVSQAFAAYASMTVEEALERACFEEVMVLEIEPALISKGPVFIYDYPACFGALARLKPEDPGYAERFELYMAGLELANGFSELTDMREQRKRFENDRQKRRESGKNCYPMPNSFLECLPHMPEAAGIAVGVDRLAMILADRDQIDDVVAFTPEEI